MSFRYRLTYPDGEDAGIFETAVPDWRVGDVFRTGDGRYLHIRAIRVPLELIEEFEERPLFAVWEVEHVQ